MEIALMRHGKVDIPSFNSRIYGSEFKQCLEIYDESELCKHSHPDKTVIEYFSTYNAVLCSDLKRSIDSANRLQLSSMVTTDSQFREVHNPTLSFPYAQFYPKTWAILIGLSWYCGLLEKQPPFVDAKRRAKHCAKKLEKMALDNEKVLLIGHGFMNTYIAKELINRGWIGPKSPAKRNWQYAIYTRNT